MKNLIMKRKIYNFVYAYTKILCKKYFHEIIYLLTPDIFQYTKNKFGRNGDGLYILPIELINNIKPEILLSFGISDDISFEEDFKKQFPETEVYTFDPTISELPSTNEELNFHQLGLAGQDMPQKKLYTIQSIVKNCNIPANSKFIVKMDIEGWEWEFLSRKDYLKYDIEVISIELHFLSLGSVKKVLFFPYYFYKRYRSIKELRRYYYIFYIHANNLHYCKFKKLIFPSLLEVTFVKKSLFESTINTEIKSISPPNIKNRLDIQYPFLVDEKKL